MFSKVTYIYWTNEVLPIRRNRFKPEQAHLDSPVSTGFTLSLKVKGYRQVYSHFETFPHVDKKEKFNPRKTFKFLPIMT